MSEVMKTGIRDYFYEPGLTGDVHIENLSTKPDNRGGWSTLVDVCVPGRELKQLVKQAAPQPMVGISLLVVRGDSILLSKRKGSHGSGQYGTPGGHLENGESFEEGALRELAEECGTDLTVATPRFLCVTNLRDYLPKHYADIGMVAHWLSGEPQTMEPDKSEGWGWYSLYNLPDGLFGAVKNIVSAFTSAQVYFPDGSG